MADVVHAYDGKRHCKACGGDFPCPGWLAQQRDVVKDRVGVWVVLETYPDAPPDVRARMETALRRSK